MFAQLAMTLEKLLKIHAFDEFHYHEILTADLTEVVGLDNVGMDQVGNESRLADKIVLKFFDGRIFFPNNFYRDNLPEITRSELHGFIDEAHAAFRDLAGHLVVELVENVLKCGHRIGERRASGSLARAHIVVGAEFAVS